MDGVHWNGAGDEEMEERRSIRDAGGRLQAKRSSYGSTARHVTRNESFIKHLVARTDTLQGIALKYGVTTEQIRRANRLWASDSLFLREHLLIPVSADSPLSGSSTVTSISESFDSTNNASSPSSVSSPVDDENSSVNDYLARLDSSIASVKKEIKKVQGSSEFLGEGDDAYVQRRRATARLRNSHPIMSNSHLVSVENQRPSSSGDMQNLPSAVVMTQGRKVRTSLQRLQKEQDEMFQL